MGTFLCFIPNSIVFDFLLCCFLIPIMDRTNRTETLMPTVTSLCGSAPIILMMDTNLAYGVYDHVDMFYAGPFKSLTSYSDDSYTAPYTCCKNIGKSHLFATDRISVSGGALRIDTLEGGAVFPGGPLPQDLQYQCSSSEEHTPLRAHISYRH